MRVGFMQKTEAKYKLFSEKRTSRQGKQIVKNNTIQQSKNDWIGFFVRHHFLGQSNSRVSLCNKIGK